MAAQKIKNGVFRSDLTLSDGRSIRYYDSAEVNRSAGDKRTADTAPQLGELRLDPLVNEWTIVAAHRTKRVFYPPKEICPLCPTSKNAAIDRCTEIPDSDYEVVSFDNRHPALSNPNSDWALPDLAGPDTDSHTAAGHCEVICFTSEHEKSIKDLDNRHLKTLITAWSDRTAELSAKPYVEYVGLFENRGQEVGVTLHHPHCQIYAYSFLPPRVDKMLITAKKYFEQSGKVLLDEIVKREIAEQKRIVIENDFWVAYVPFAAKYPFEIHVAPKQSVADLAQLNEAQLNSWPDIASAIMKKLDGVYEIAMPYIAAWYQAPAKKDRDVMRLHWQINCVRSTPEKLKYLAGSESAMGAFVADQTPEQIAEVLKNVKI